MHAGEVLAMSADGNVSQVVRAAGGLSGLGWLGDGSLLVVAMRDRQLLRLKEDGDLVCHADLSSLATGDCNDMVVDGRGNAYVGNFGAQEPTSGKRFPAEMVLVRPDGEAKLVAKDLGFPNGCVVTADNRTMIVAESKAQLLTGFTVLPDGNLAGRCVWAELPGVLPDGLALDQSGAVWCADPRGRRCIRVDQGGSIQDQIATEDPCYACALGGPDRKTLYLCTSAHSDPEEATDRRSGQLLSARVEIGGAGWP
jgi:sugar lactone lactonase YvrE